MLCSDSRLREISRARALQQHCPTVWPFLGHRVSTQSRRCAQCHSFSFYAPSKKLHICSQGGNDNDQCTRTMSSQNPRLLLTFASCRILPRDVWPGVSIELTLDRHIMGKARLHGTSAHYLQSITVLLFVELGNALLNLLNLCCGKSKHCLRYVNRQYHGVLPRNMRSGDFLLNGYLNLQTLRLQASTWSCYGKQQLTIIIIAYHRQREGGIWCGVKPFLFACHRSVPDYTIPLSVGSQKRF